MSENEELSIIEQFRESHHAVARMVAAGMEFSAIQHRTGMSRRRLTLLMGDPSFNELIAIYRERVEEKWNENVDRYLDLGMKNMIRAESLIADKLEEDEVPLMLLDRISQGRADRFGYAKNSTLRVEHDFASALDRAISRSGKDPKLIEHQPATYPAEEQAPSPSQRPVLVLERPKAPAQPKPSASRSFERVLRRKVA